MGIAQHSANDQSGGYQPLGGFTFPVREREKERKCSLSELNMVKAKVILI